MFLGQFCAFQLDAIHVSHSAQTPCSEIFLPGASRVVPQLLRVDIGVGKPLPKRMALPCSSLTCAVSHFFSQFPTCVGVGI